MFREEFRKIWRPGMIFVLIVLGFIYYTMFLEFYIRYFPNGPHYEGVFYVARQMKETYGTSLSEKEMAEFETGIPLLQKEADRYVENSETGKKYGLKTYEQYAEFRKNVYDGNFGTNEAADLNEIYTDCMIMDNCLQGEDTDNIEGRLYAACLFEAQYHQAEKYGTYQTEEGYSPKELEHARKLFFGPDKKWQNILPEEIPRVTGTYAGLLLVWICLSVCLLLSPLAVHDRMAGMHVLQYSSRHGRKIYKSQFAAVMASAFLLVTANLILFGGIFAVHGTSAFFPCRMYSFMGTQYCWPEWTHGTWCLMLVLNCYLTAAGAAGMVFFLSDRSTNYIGMMLKILPLFVIFAILCPKIMEHAFYFENKLYQFTGIPHIELICAAAVSAAGAVLCWYGSLRAEKESV